MKTKLTLITAALLTAGTLLADPAKSLDQYFKYYIDPGTVRLSLEQPVTQTKVDGGRFSYSGVAVQVVKTKNFWQLFNPAAPAAYDSHGNFDRDIITGKPVGFKFFSLSF